MTSPGGIAEMRSASYVGTMGIMMLAWLVIVIAVTWVTLALVTRGLSRGSTPDQGRLLTRQTEQIEELEDELRRLKEQADFTEKLLSERSAPPRDGSEWDREGPEGEPHVRGR